MRRAVIMSSSLLVLVLLTFSCTTTTSQQTTDTGTVETTSYHVNTDELSALIGIGNQAWQIIAAAQGASNEASNDPSLADYVGAVTDIINALGGTKAAFTQDAVYAAASNVSMAFYKAGGHMPEAGVVSMYVVQRKMPTARELKEYREACSGL